MTYKINIEGMHCSGCENLIKMSLEEVNFGDIEVSMKSKSAKFSSHQELPTVKESLDNIFSAFDDYKYSNLVLV
jgi:copper chaperone CopZ